MGNLQATTLRVIKDKEVIVSKIAHGLPIGADLSFADTKTLTVALNNRIKINQRVTKMDVFQNILEWFKGLFSDLSAGWRLFLNLIKQF